jgi:hypothetical protein
MSSRTGNEAVTGSRTGDKAAADCCRPGQKRALCPEREQSKHLGGSLHCEMRWFEARQLKQRLSLAFALSNASKSSPSRPDTEMQPRRSKTEGTTEAIAPRSARIEPHLTFSLL